MDTRRLSRRHLGWTCGLLLLLGAGGAGDAAAQEPSAAPVFRPVNEAASGAAGTVPAKDTPDALASLPTFDLPPQSSLAIRFQATIDSPLAAGTTGVENQAVITSTTVPPEFPPVNSDDPDDPADDDPTTTAIDQETDLRITKTDGSTTAIPGTAVVYTIEAINAGPLGVTGATVADAFPGNLSGCSWTCAGTGGASCTAGPVAGNILDTAVDLPGGGVAKATYTVTCTIDPAATGTLSNMATITPPGGIAESDNGNNNATDVDTLVPTLDLAITKDDGLTTVVPGQVVSYTIEVTHNGGPSDVTGATVADAFPAELTNCNWSCVASGAASCTAAGAGAINDTVDLPVGDKVTYTATCDVDPLAASDVVNTATVSVPAGTTDTDPGNDSATDTDTLNPDTTPPNVTQVSAGTAASLVAIDDCATVRSSVTRIAVTFDEAMDDAGGGAQPNDVSNPAGYLLLRPASAGAGYDTSACGVGTGADVVVAIPAVSYDGGSLTATLDVGGSADGLHRLIVCDTLRDEASNALNGGDLVLDFRVDPENLLENGHFDYCTGDPAVSPNLGPWTPMTPAPGDLSHATADVDSSPLSGSARMQNPTGGTELTIEQCVPVDTGPRFVLEAGVRVDAPPGAIIGFGAECTFFALPACAGAEVGSGGFGHLYDESAAGSWQRFSTIIPISGAQSAFCLFAFEPATNDFSGFFDDLSLSSVIFVDGFESGDTSAWSSTVP